MQAFTPGCFGGLYFGNYRASFERVDGHIKIVVSGTVSWSGVTPPGTFPIWVRVYYKDKEMDRWETWYDPFQPGPYYFTVDKVYDVPKGGKIKIVAGYSYLVWEIVTDEKEIVITDYFSPYIKSCTFDVVSPYVGVLKIVLASEYAPDTDKVVTLVIGSGPAPCKWEDRVWYKDLVWPAGKSEVMVELTCSREGLPGYVYVPEGRYWVCIVCEGQYYDYKYVDIRYVYEYVPFWERVFRWVGVHKYEMLAVALILLFAGVFMVKMRHKQSVKR